MRTQQLKWINLPGYKFYQEYRKCGKDGCRSCSDGERGHGPYWFRRDLRTGIRKYIGADLPEGVKDADYWYKEEVEHIERQMRHYMDMANALRRLRYKKPLEPGDAELIGEAGIIMAVIYEPED